MSPVREGNIVEEASLGKKMVSSVRLVEFEVFMEYHRETSSKELEEWVWNSGFDGLSPGTSVSRDNSK